MERRGDVAMMGILGGNAGEKRGSHCIELPKKLRNRLLDKLAGQQRRGKGTIFFGPRVRAGLSNKPQRHKDWKTSKLHVVGRRKTKGDLKKGGGRMWQEAAAGLEKGKQDLLRAEGAGRR